MKKRLKVLLLFHSAYFRPRGYEFKEEFADPEDMYTENDVYKALLANNYEVRLLGIYNDLSLLFEEIKDFSPDVIFNMVEVFHDQTHWEKNVAGLLEMLNIPYTGASAASLFICKNKALCKKILRFHRVRVPRFYDFYRGRKVWLPRQLRLPCIIKPLTEEASRGISLASVVDKEETFIERIHFIHNHMNNDAIAEEYIEGRELYVTVFGNKRLTIFPPREIKFGQLPQDEPRIATYKAKWDDDYRDKWGIKSVFAGKLPNGLEENINEVCKRAYRALNIEGYVRFDIRVTENHQIYIIEPNANPCLARIDEFAQSAEKIGISYNQLIKKIVNQALQREKS